MGFAIVYNIDSLINDSLTGASRGGVASAMLILVPILWWSLPMAPKSSFGSQSFGTSVSDSDDGDGKLEISTTSDGRLRLQALIDPAAALDEFSNDLYNDITLQMHLL
jgi:hypothetical protein